MESLGTILGVWAHPDDETYSMAGLMARGVRAGSRVTCVTATRGELGSWDEDRWPSAELGKVREAELLSSLAILGVTEHRFLDYLDGACAAVDPEEGIARVGEIIASVEPDSVLTFGPDGMTGHADHKAVCSWTTEAFRRRAKRGARLYYATQTPEWAAEFVPVLNRFDVFAPGTPVVTPAAELAIDFELPQDLLDLKLRAISEHVSQVEGMLGAFGPDFFRRSMRAEFFRLAEEQCAAAAPMIRDARPEELDDIAAVMSAAYAEYMRPDPVFEDYARDIADVRSRLAESDLIVAEIGGAIAGAVTFYPDGRSGEGGWAPGWAGIRLLAVHPGFRGRGIGRKLAEECIERARALGRSAVGLHTTTLMEVARGMYERMGFRRAPEFDFHPGAEVVVMGYRLDL